MSSTTPVLVWKYAQSDSLKEQAKQLPFFKCMVISEAPKSCLNQAA